MAVVALTDQEKATLIGDGGTFKSTLQQKVLARTTYLMGLSAVDLNTFTFQKQRKYSAQVKSDLNRLFGDSTITGFSVFSMMTRALANKETNGGAELNDQVIAYLNTSNRFDLLVDDFLAEKIKFEPYE